DPKKLNDEKEKINYKNIPAELAWEINLPLPDNYEFVFLSAGVSGHAAMVKFLEDCNCRLFSKYSHRGNNIFGAYCDQYAFLN
ncbi:capsular biosynthesis protein, partial [Escherichia coli]|nr:capsular biosynthesis protein [Escherichia coli]